MSTRLHDITSNALLAPALTISTVTTTTTGTYQDMILGDNRCALIVQCSGTTVTSLTVRVQQCTTTNGTYTDISGASVALTTDGIGSVTFDRDYRYLKAAAVISGTTAPCSAMFVEQLKVV